MKKILILIFLLFYSIISYSSPKIFIFHINGVNTDIAQASKNIITLREKSNVKSKFIEWDLLYNESTGLMSDLYDVFKQKSQESKNIDIHSFIEAYMKLNNLNYKQESEEYKMLMQSIKNIYLQDPQFVGKNLNNIVDRFHDKIPYESISEFLKDYQNRKDAYILFVSHSQGNLYANELYNFITVVEKFPSENLALVGIASPASYQSGHDSVFITAKFDKVISALTTFSYVMPWSNTPLGYNHDLKCVDVLCHNFIDTYLDDENIKYINDAIYYKLSSLKYKMMTDGLKNESVNFIMDARNLKDYDIVSSSGTAIYQNGKINEKFVGTMEYGSPDKVDWIFGYLPSGVYYLLYKKPYTGSLMISIDERIYGNIKSATKHYVDYSNRKCEIKTYETARDHYFYKRSIGYINSEYRCTNTEIMFFQKPIISKITVG